MTGAATRAIAHIDGDGRGVSGNAPRDTTNGRIVLFGRAMRPAGNATRGPEAEIAWKVAFRSRTLTGCKPHGECRLRSFG